MQVLDLEVQPGARAFVRDDLVHLRNRLAGTVYCGAMEVPTEHGITDPESLEPSQPLADGATPQEAGMGDDASAWAWCDGCRSMAEAGGLLVEVDDGVSGTRARGG